MKPELRGLHHDHIDGSRAMLGVIGELYRLSGKPFRFSSEEEWKEYFGNPVENIVAKFDTVTSVLQSAETLELAGYAYGRHRAAEGFCYVEAKFAPQYFTRGGLTMKAATAAIFRGLKRAQSETGTVLLPVICIGREATPDVGVEIARIALDYDGEMALDMVCDEAGHPPEKHLPAYQTTFGSRVKRDCHAGEWVSREPAVTYRARLAKNVRTALFDLRCDGIGHAIPLADEPELTSFIVANGIRVSGCPLSNKFCGNIQDVRELRIPELLDRGVIYTINPDDDLFMPTADEVAAACDDAYGFTPEQRRRLEENVFLGAFHRDAEMRRC